MNEYIEQAKEGIEDAGHKADSYGSARSIAVMIAALAAMLALAEMGEKAAQNSYLTNHIQATDDWSFFQAKTIRAEMNRLQAELLESQPNGTDPAVLKRIAATRANVDRLNNEPDTGRIALQDKARRSEHIRDAAFHSYHLFELVVGILQIAIVLASVSVVTRVSRLAVAAAVMGVGAALFGVMVALHLI